MTVYTVRLTEDAIHLFRNHSRRIVDFTTSQRKRERVALNLASSRIPLEIMQKS